MYVHRYMEKKSIHRDMYTDMYTDIYTEIRDKVNRNRKSSTRQLVLPIGRVPGF